MTIFRQFLHSIIDFLILGILTYTIKAFIQSATIFVDNVKIILIETILPDTNISFLQVCFFKIEPNSISNSTKLKFNAKILF